MFVLDKSVRFKKVPLQYNRLTNFAKIVFHSKRLQLPVVLNWSHQKWPTAKLSRYIVYCHWPAKTFPSWGIIIVDLRKRFFDWNRSQSESTWTLFRIISFLLSKQNRLPSSNKQEFQHSNFRLMQIWLWYVKSLGPRQINHFRKKRLSIKLVQIKKWEVRVDDVVDNSDIYFKYTTWHCSILPRNS